MVMLRGGGLDGQSTIFTGNDGAEGLMVRKMTGTAPAVPLLAAGLKAATLGDSIIQFGNQVTAGGAIISNDADSEIAWALYRIGHRVKHQIWYDPVNASGESPDRVTTYGNTTRVATGDILFSGANLGYAGDTATGVGLRLLAGRNTTAALWIYAAGTNVGSTDSPVGTVTAKIAEAIAYAVANNIRIIVGTVRPRRVAVSPTGTEISPAIRDRALAINDWIRANAPGLGAIVWDPWEDLRDPAYPVGNTLYGSDKPGVTRDNVHLSPIGAWLSSATLATAIAQAVAAGSWFSTDPTVSNILATGIFPGTGGTANNGASGTLPNGCFLSNVSGVGQPLTAVASVEANPDTGGQSIVMDFTSTGAGAANVTNVFNLSFTNPTSGFAAGQYVQAFFETDIGAASAATLLVGAQVTLGQASTISARGLGQVANLTSYNSQPFPDEALGIGWIASEPLLIGAQTGLNPRLNMAFRADVAGTRRIKVRRAILRVVPSPVTEFPWTPT